MGAAFRICPLCEACCGLELALEGDRVSAGRGYEADVASHGVICPKGAVLGERHADPDRLRMPRVKRDGRHGEVSWDEAFAEIERRLPPILARGRDSVALSLGNPTAHKFGLLLYGARFGRALGTKNIYSASTLDQMPKQLACGLMFGHWLSVPVPDLVRTDLVGVLGANPVVSNGSMWTVPDFRGKAKAMQARGGKLIVIAPRRPETAAMADQHLFIRPGGDVFLLLGIANAIGAAKRVKLGRLAEHVAGLDDFAAAVAPFTPARVAARCGIDAAQIEELVYGIAAANRAAVYGRIGTCTQEYGTLASWLVDAINVITGNLDAPGGAMFPKAAAFAANTRGTAGRGKGITTGRRRSRVSGAPEVFGEFPMGCLAEEIETPGDGQIRALVTVVCFFVLSSPNGARLAKAMASLELVISLDIYLNETTRHADVILPGLSPLEAAHYDVAIAMGRGASADLRALDDELTGDDVRRTAGPFAEPMLAAVKDLRGPERLLDLALRAGPYGDRFGQNPQGLSLARLRAHHEGKDLGEIEPRVPAVLRTPSGKIELAPAMLVADLARVAAALARAE